MIVLNVLTVVCGVLCAFFGFIDASQTKKDKKSTKKWLDKLWRKLDSSTIKNLPELSIKWFINLPAELKSFIRKNMLVFLPILALVVFPTMYYLTTTESFGTFKYLSNSFLIGFGAFLLITLAGEQLPKFMRWLMVFCVIFFSSMGVTELAVILGGDISWESIRQDPNSGLMLYWYYYNALFDVLTLYFTFSLLKFLIKQRIKLLVPYIILDILLASIFAVLSLYLTLNSTTYKLEWKEVFNILIGLSPDGKSIQLGSYFWAMHTTFLPTLIYMSYLLLAIFGKVIVLPICKLSLKRVSVVERPYYLTSAFFGLIGTILYAVIKALS